VRARPTCDPFARVFWGFWYRDGGPVPIGASLAGRQNAEGASGPSTCLEVPRRQKASVVTDERIDERDDVGDEINPTVWWSQRERSPLAQRVVAALPVGHIGEGLGEQEDGMPPVIGHGVQRCAESGGADCVDAAEDPHVGEVPIA
jgi:hypothetical protein